MLCIDIVSGFDIYINKQRVLEHEPVANTSVVGLQSDVNKFNEMEKVYLDSGALWVSFKLMRLRRPWDNPYP